MKTLIVAAFCLFLGGCGYRTPSGDGGAITVNDWQVAARTLPDGSLDWARLVPPPDLQPAVPADYTVTAGVDHTGQWSVRIFKNATPGI